MYIGEVLTSGELASTDCPAPQNRIEIQFKGAGLTPYSRNADGRKVLRSSLREFLASEHMHALGIPTTRALSLVTSDTLIIRDQFYTGEEKQEKASVIVRMAPSFFRFGSFEVCKPKDPETGRVGPCVGKLGVLKQLIDYTISSFYPDIQRDFEEKTRQVEQSNNENQMKQDHLLQVREERDLAFFSQVCALTGKLIAKWQCIGFIHGVMNTDNMSILGLTIDYGPYQFMDTYLPASTSNTSDNQFRYSYLAQPEIAAWNLRKLAEELSRVQTQPPAAKNQMFQFVQNDYWSSFHQEYDNQMRKKLGLREKQKEETSDEAAEITALISDLMTTMRDTGADFTNTFRALSSFSTLSESPACLEAILSNCVSLEEHLESLAPRIPAAQLAYLAQLLKANVNLGDTTGVIQEEIERRRRRADWNGLNEAAKRERDSRRWQEWLDRYRLMLTKQLPSFSDSSPSLTLQQLERRRMKSQLAHNPKYVLRNWIAQELIEAAEKGDFSKVQQAVQLFTDPYALNEEKEQRDKENQEFKSKPEQRPEEAEKASVDLSREQKEEICRVLPAVIDQYAGKPPVWARQLRVT